MFLLSTAASSLKEERERCGLSIAQAAALADTTSQMWEAIEAGLVSMSAEFVFRLRDLGFDAQYIGTGERRARREVRFIPSELTEDGGDASAESERIKALIASEERAHDLSFKEDPFLQAVALLRRSSAAVEAFIGEGVASKSPELVAALMNAASRLEVGSATSSMLEEFRNALDGVAGQMADSSEALVEAVAGVAEELEKLSQD